MGRGRPDVTAQDRRRHGRTRGSGLSEVNDNSCGPRTWCGRTFDNAAVKVKGVKVTFANKVKSSYKVVDAVKLVGE